MSGRDRVDSVDVPVSGHCDARFRAVREEFARNFAERGEVGAAVCVVVDGVTVVDLAGGWADQAGAHALAARHAGGLLLGRQGVRGAAGAAAGRRRAGRARRPHRRRVAGVRRRGQGGGDPAPRAVPPRRRAGHPRAADQRRPVGLGPDGGRAGGDRAVVGARDAPRLPHQHLRAPGRRGGAPGEWRAVRAAAGRAGGAAGRRRARRCPAGGAAPLCRGALRRAGTARRAGRHARGRRAAWRC